MSPYNHVRVNRKKQGKPMSQNAFRERLYKLEDKAGIRRNVPHGFRVTQSTLLVNNCHTMDEIKAVAKRLGHNYKTMLEYYQRVINDNQKELFERTGIQVI